MTGSLSFGPIEKAVYNAEEALLFLGLDSVRSLERLVQQKRLIPLRIAKCNLFAKRELEDFVTREIEREWKLRNAD